MTRRMTRAGLAAVFLLVAVMPSTADEKANKKDQDKEANVPVVYPAAIFAFEERGAGAKEMGAKVSDILFAKLVDRDELHLVDREELKKTLAELELNLSG